MGKLRSMTAERMREMDTNLGLFSEQIILEERLARTKTAHQLAGLTICAESIRDQIAREEQDDAIAEIMANLHVGSKTSRSEELEDDDPDGFELVQEPEPDQPGQRMKQIDYNEDSDNRGEQ